ncbi:uncharacterized protein LOC133496825 isoform X2 [Syngnathoides biaculeatus]|uniref:uncharacterized protein LOC133496825 isoform X2 n=1 Tax=Syngnathoides biaculeatus TaxID=300417 RepID=UPI002ADE5235|nr:uncharacterized protein LOC133496825 isoform X2 [Syngnathoides biaculeatus]
MSRGIRGQTIEIFARAGDVATLPCLRSSCSRLAWLYSRDEGNVLREVKDGQVQASSDRSQRLSLNDDCSLMIAQVTGEDAGSFTCLQDGSLVVTVLLSVMTLTISSLPVSDPMGKNKVVLKCSLTCYPAPMCICRPGRLRWMDEEGGELRPRTIKQNNCVSILKIFPIDVKRKYTCQYIRRNDVWVQAQYRASEEPGDPPPGYIRHINIIRVTFSVLLLVIAVVAIVLIKMKLRRNAAQ